MADTTRYEVPLISVEEARSTAGLRLVVQQTVPNPWSESAKAITYVKRIAHHRVGRVSRFKAQHGANDALLAWTGMDSAPIAMWQDDSPRDHWARILNLCERIAPEPRLIPRDPAERADMFGLCHEICDEDGFGWNRRLILLRTSAQKPGGAMTDLDRKYGAGGDLDQVYQRISDIIGLLADRLNAQKACSSPYFVGDALSAADIYWACFSILLVPPPSEQCPLEDHVRQIYTLDRSLLNRPVDPILLHHRDFILKTYLELPIQV